MHCMQPRYYHAQAQKHNNNNNTTANHHTPARAISAVHSLLCPFVLVCEWIKVSELRVEVKGTGFTVIDLHTWNIDLQFSLTSLFAPYPALQVCLLQRF